MHHARRRLTFGMLCLILLPAGRVAAQAPAPGNGYPLKLAPRPTTAEITEADLQTRLYIFADDSMQGRQFGREGNFKGTAYIAQELERLGLQPAGDAGTWFQGLPAVVRKYTDRSELSADGQPLRWNIDYLAVPGRTPARPFESAQAVYGGVVGDTLAQISAEQAAGKLVILTPAPAGATPAGVARGRPGFGVPPRFAGAAAIATVDLETLRASRARPRARRWTWRRGARPRAPPSTTRPAPEPRGRAAAAAFARDAPDHGRGRGPVAG
ncbi:MAG: hypothetical protein FIB01_15945 [Gemmatimonadetes bacterium]|nr:hypothetical protein [Gemmatimonadota bacterium]